MFIDSHCHLDFSVFDLDRTSIIQQCADLDINTIIIPGTQANRWQQQIALCNQHSQLRFSLGLHPYFLDCFKPADLVVLQQLLALHKQTVVALGEIGLDAKIEVPWSLQREVFCQQLAIATDHKLPVILHHRHSHNELIRTLKAQRFSQGGIVHAFSGSVQQAESYIDLGFKIGVGGGITYPRANKTRQAISQLPLHALVLETDAPDMPLMGKQAQRNSPEYLPDIFETLLALRTESRQELQQACMYNVHTSLRL